MIGCLEISIAKANPKKQLYFKEGKKAKERKKEELNIYKSINKRVKQGVN